MSVTGYHYNINATKKLQDVELQEGYEGNRSWHHKFKDSAYIYIGGLHAGLTEGDVVIVFSQFGEIVDVNLIRDRATGKSKGFAFVCYEDQKSTILAVDNMNGFSLLNRTLRVDHVEKYKAPKNLDENDLDENGDPKLLEYHATGAEGKGLGKYNEVRSQQHISSVQTEKEKKALADRKAAQPEDEDEKWAKAFDTKLEEKANKKALKKEREEIKKMKKETKKLKKMAKAAKKAKKEGKKVKKAAGKKSKKDASDSDSSDSDDSGSSS
eukprot:TRINITY_DN504_c0_g1_i1.p1 TRINITY_DN504_c0_g1~~TRINITY_DN504_c0_g1_i1.p1  ORF type:complete len:268 (+),score=97.32 TRINITY_DN504_c0_g1_i1:138-941(+)